MPDTLMLMPRKVPIDKDKRTITAEAVAERIDENTICVGCVLGTTFTGEIDPVKDINDLLLEYKKEKGWDSTHPYRCCKWRLHIALYRTGF